MGLTVMEPGATAMADSDDVLAPRRSSDRPEKAQPCAQPRAGRTGRAGPDPRCAVLARLQISDQLGHREHAWVDRDVHCGGRTRPSPGHVSPDTVHMVGRRRGRQRRRGRRGRRRRRQRRRRQRRQQRRQPVCANRPTSMRVVAVGVRVDRRRRPDAPARQPGRELCGLGRGRRDPAGVVGRGPLCNSEGAAHRTTSSNMVRWSSSETGSSGKQEAASGEWQAASGKEQAEEALRIRRRRCGACVCVCVYWRRTWEERMCV